MSLLSRQVSWGGIHPKQYKFQTFKWDKFLISQKKKVDYINQQMASFISHITCFLYSPAQRPRLWRLFISQKVPCATKKSC